MRLRCRIWIHEWQDWKFVSDKSCEERRYCKHCSSFQKRTGNHDWSETCKCGKGSCKRCGEYRDSYAISGEQICSECGTQLDGFMNC